jgi:hypothetical protein
LESKRRAIFFRHRFYFFYQPHHVSQRQQREKIRGRFNALKKRTDTTVSPQPHTPHSKQTWLSKIVAGRARSCNLMKRARASPGRCTKKGSDDITHPRVRTAFVCPHSAHRAMRTSLKNPAAILRRQRRDDAGFSPHQPADVKKQRRGSQMTAAEGMTITTGKPGTPRSVSQNSNRSPMVPIDCAACTTSTLSPEIRGTAPPRRS